MALNRGLEKCPGCGKIVKINRHVPHPETKECTVRQVNDRYAARGWRRVGFARAEIIKEALGVDKCEVAPGTVTTEVDSVFDDATKERTQRSREVVWDGYYVPGAAADAIEALGHVRLKPSVRREAVRILAEQPALVIAIDAVRRLDGSIPKFVKQMIAEHGNAEPYDIVGEKLEQLVHRGTPSVGAKFEEDHDDD